MYITFEHTLLLLVAVLKEAGLSLIFYSSRRGNEKKGPWIGLSRNLQDINLFNFDTIGTIR